jgi:hypothetical protein
MRGSVSTLSDDKIHGRLGVDAGGGKTKIQTRRKPMPVAEHRPKRLISFASLNRTFCIENERKILENFGQNWRVFAPQLIILDKIGANFDLPVFGRRPGTMLQVRRQVGVVAVLALTGRSTAQLKTDCIPIGIR